jgi:hypothetical protein
MRIRSYSVLFSFLFLSCASELAEMQGQMVGDLPIRQVDKISVNTILENPDGSGCSDPPTAINIAPAVYGDPSSSGPSTTINGTDVFQEILAAAGINACEDDPANFCDEYPGLLGPPITGGDGDASGVLNEGGHRATFGFYITYFKCDQAYEYFALFSYDKVGDNCAFEFFLFGPITRGNDGKPNSAPLLQGLAIDKDGNMLDAVPTNIAAEENYAEGGPQEGQSPTPVTPGVGTAGQNCRYCHTRGDDTPDHNQPFPWGVATINGQPLPAYQEANDAP